MVSEVVSEVELEAVSGEVELLEVLESEVVLEVELLGSGVGKVVGSGVGNLRASTAQGTGI